MRIKISLPLIIVLLLSLNVFAQSKEGKQADIEKYKRAIQLSEEAENAWNDNKIPESEKLFLQSTNAYLTTGGMNQLAKFRVKIGDIKGANLAWSILLQEASKYTEVIERKGGGYQYSNTKELITPILEDQGELNARNGNILEAYKAYLGFEKYIADAEEFGENYYTLSLYACQTGNFSTAERAIDSMRIYYSDKKNTKKHVFRIPSVVGAVKKSLRKGESDLQLHIPQAECNLLMAKGAYEKAIEKADELEKADKGLNTTWKGVARLIKAEAYAAMGNLLKANEFLDLTLKHVAYTRSTPNVQYVMGIINLMEKKYTEAIKNFNSEMNYKNTSILSLNNYTAWGKYRYYSGRAEAYIGLKDFLKARKDYETALLYNPEYEPALSGLAKLEGRIVSEIRTDKTPPEITLTEPGGIENQKISSAESQIMIKGFAKDFSGLKTVFINDQNVYVQEQGDFWGTVNLKNGVNKMVVKATDLAGNTSEKIFEIEKQEVASEIVVNNEITAGKPSQNYALIIAAQNYDDLAIPALTNPVADAIRLKLILKTNYNFQDDNIYAIYNPAINDFKKVFAEIMEVIQPEDNIIIFYAGHGIWVEKEKKGYWLLTDAKINDVNTWLSNKIVLNLIAKLPARHTLLITDACFSGSVFKTRGIGEETPVKSQYEKITRVAITSGNDTEVPDQSVFMKYLIKALTENKEKNLSAQKMFINQIIEAVMTETKTEPRYGTLELAGHMGGDYIFIRK